MSKPPRSLKTLRRQIDETDTQLHDLLMRRAALVAEVGVAKQEEHARVEVPVREAEILRRLLGRHSGKLPLGALVRLWRELMGAAIVMQVDFSVAVAVPEADPGIWDLARDHYGSQVPMTAYRSPGEVLRALAELRHDSGVIAVPAGDGDDAWWRALAGGAGDGPRINARLPFAGRGNARGRHDAFVVGRAANGVGDRTLFMLEMSGEASRDSLITVLAQGDVAAVVVQQVRGKDGSVALIDVDAPLAADDPRLATLLAGVGKQLVHVAPVGSYAKPLPPVGDAAPAAK
ncbi:MAG: chorismate mutase [Alphaproteobacteria bacterium]|nr:chorismate mutase [Alphaproteobacteria bacterium]